MGLSAANEKPVMAVKNTVIEKETYSLNDYREFTLNDLETEMKVLNN